MFNDDPIAADNLIERFLCLGVIPLPHSPLWTRLAHIAFTQYLYRMFN